MPDHTDEEQRGRHGQMATGEARFGPIGASATDLLDISPTARHLHRCILPDIRRSSLHRAQRMNKVSFDSSLLIFSSSYFETSCKSNRLVRTTWGGNENPPGITFGHPTDQCAYS